MLTCPPPMYRKTGGKTCSFMIYTKQMMFITLYYGGAIDNCRRANIDCDGICFGSSHTSDLKNDTPVAALPDAWRYRAWGR